MKKKAMHHIIYPQNIEQAEDEKMCSLMQKKKYAVLIFPSCAK
jgi:hypothetical protein